MNETGKNFTQCSDSVLSSIIADYEAETFMEEQEGVITVDTVKTIVNEELDKRDAQSEYSLNSLALCILKVINFFEFTRIVNKAICDHWRKAIRKDYTPYTQEELDNMND
jgi:bisphosphoglycerate-independent phosphoglycerate mutase (AlkP superfamily)